MSNKCFDTKNEEIKKELEKLTRKHIIITPTGPYKLEMIKKTYNLYEYSVSFIKLHHNQSHNSKLEFKVKTNYKLNYIKDIDCFSILDYMDINSYNDENSPYQRMCVEIEGLSDKAKKYEGYFKEFLFNYAKLEQNDVNRVRGIGKVYLCEFSILKNKSLAVKLIKEIK